jgi:hypothetical protein
VEDRQAVTVILAIDPGPEKSAWLVLRDGRPRRFLIQDNDDLLKDLRVVGRGVTFDERVDEVVIEQVRSYGMSVGAEIFDTVHWAGRFTEAANPQPVHQLPRLKVKQAICHDSRAKDANIRQALIDRFGGPTSIRKGGPLYGVSKDVWSALGLAVAYSEGAR